MTIEERAESYKQKIQNEAYSEGVEILAPNAYYAGYKQGATEQREIENKRYEEFLKYMYEQITKSLASQRKNIIEKACGLAMTYLLVTTPQEVAEERLKSFRKVLESN